MIKERRSCRLIPRTWFGAFGPVALVGPNLLLIHVVHGKQIAEFERVLSGDVSLRRLFSRGFCIGRRTYTMIQGR
jgi:hypothetical protein